MKKNLLKATVVTATMTILNAVSVFAETAEKTKSKYTEFKPEDIANGSSDLLDPVIEQVQSIGASIFSLGNALGVVVFVSSIIICGLCFMIYRGAMKKDENKSAFANTFLGAGCVFAAVPIATIFMEIIKG